MRDIFKLGKSDIFLQKLCHEPINENQNYHKYIHYYLGN